jgi:hypothetical protein
MSARGGAPECRGAGTKVQSRNNGGGARWTRKWICDVCGRTVPLNYDGRLRWHTPNPKRKDASS